MTDILVIGGGVAGCAAAVAAAEAGASVTLLEASAHLGGVAARGEHRTLCGLGIIDAEKPDLVEPELTAAWLPLLATGAAFRQGRVWLWPTDSRCLQEGLRKRLEHAGVRVLLRTKADSIESHASRHVIDASGRGMLAAKRQKGEQWPSHRSVLRFSSNEAEHRAGRLRLLAAAQQASGGNAAIALTPMADARWQLSLDVRPGTAVAAAAATAERVAAAIGAEVIASACAVAERDEGRPAAQLTCEELFATAERGLCWASWPREQHGPEGTDWTWPARDRYGISERAARLDNCWFIGKGMPVDLGAAAALRVTGTCLALGTSIGRKLANERR